MSYQASTWAFEQRIAKPGAKAVLVALAHRADAHGYCYPGQDTLASMTGLDARTVRAHLKQLEADGYIKRSRALDERGRRTSDDIHLLAPPERLAFSSPEKSPVDQPDNRKKTARLYRKKTSPEKSPAKESEDKDEESDRKTPEAQPPASPRESRDAAGDKSDHTALMAYLAERCGPIPDGAAQGRAIKWLLGNYTLEQCRACLDDLRAQEWRNHRVSWLTVQKEIGDWLTRKENRNASNGRPESRRGRDHAETRGRQPTHYERLIDDLAATDPAEVFPASAVQHAAT